MSLLTLLLVAGCCGAVGVWVLHFGDAILAESFTHALLPGLVLAVLIGSGLYLGAVIGVLAAWLLLSGAARAPRTTNQVSHSVSVTSLLAVGALLVGDERLEHFEELLFGDPLSGSTGDLFGAFALTAVVVGGLLLLHGRFSALAFDPGAAASLGVSTGLVTALALALLAVTVSAAAVTVGSLLALALVTAPAFGVAALRLRVGRSLPLAALAGAGGCLVGVLLAELADLPVGATIALTLCAWAVLTAAWPARSRATASVG